MTKGLKAAPFATTPDRVAAITVKGIRSGRRTVWAPGMLRWVFSALRHLPGAGVAAPAARLNRVSCVGSAALGQFVVQRRTPLGTDADAGRADPVALSQAWYSSTSAFS